jgi:outer membrane protein assembly factor BamB
VLRQDSRGHHRLENQLIPHAWIAAGQANIPDVFGEFGPVYKRPQRGWAEDRTGGHPARRLIVALTLALVVGAILGLVLMLQFKGRSALVKEGAVGCGTASAHGSPSNPPCSRGIDWAVGWTDALGLGTVLTTGVLLLIPPARRALLVTGTAGPAVSAAVFIVGAAGGLLAGVPIFSTLHGTDLSIAWTAPADSAPDLTTVGAWVDAGSLVRVRVDQVVSYDGATGQPGWTLPIPGVDVACSASSDTGSDGAGTIGLVMYGPDSTSCDHVMAVDLATGQQVWAAPVQSSTSGVLGVAGGTAVVLTDDAIIGLDARTGAQRWTLTSQCDFQQLDASGGSAVALARCQGASYDVVSIDPATGKAAWQSHVSEPSDDYQFQLLSASPVVVSDDLTGPRGRAEVRVFGPGGAATATFPVSGIPEPGAGGLLTLNFASTSGFGVPVVITDGQLVGVAEDNAGHSALVSFALSSGKRQWLVPLPDEVHDISAGVGAQGGQVMLVDESNPAYSLEEAGLATGKLRSFGYFRQSALESDGSALYAVGNDYLVVNVHGSDRNPPVAAITAPGGRQPAPGAGQSSSAGPGPVLARAA